MKLGHFVVVLWVSRISSGKQAQSRVEKKRLLKCSLNVSDGERLGRFVFRTDRNFFRRGASNRLVRDEINVDKFRLEVSNFPCTSVTQFRDM